MVHVRMSVEHVVHAVDAVLNQAIHDTLAKVEKNVMGDLLRAASINEERTGRVSSWPSGRAQGTDVSDLLQKCIANTIHSESHWRTHCTLVVVIP